MTDVCAKIIVITSCKGGVGKSTVSANLALELVFSGHRTLLVDCDFGNRSLDLLLGVQNKVVYDLNDVISGAVAPERAVMENVITPGLLFCPAPYDVDEDTVSPEAFEAALRAMIERYEPEYVLLDTPGSVGQAFRLAASVSDEAYVISTCQPSAIRAAERTGGMLEDYGVKERRLIINMFDPGQFADAPDSSPLAIIDGTCLRLLAIIPFDPAVMTMQAEGRCISELKGSNVPAAYRNLLRRMLGQNIPLFTDFKHIRRAKLIKSL